MLSIVCYKNICPTIHEANMEQTHRHPDYEGYFKTCLGLKLTITCTFHAYVHSTQHLWQILLLTRLRQNYRRKQTMPTSMYTFTLSICNPLQRPTDLPDCRRELVLRLLPMVVPSGMNTATRRAHITNNAPNTNGGPGTSCNIHIHSNYTIKTLLTF